MRRAALIAAMSASLLCLGGILGGCRSLEEKLIFPGAASQGQPYAAIPPSKDYELIPLVTSDGTRIVAQFGGALDSLGQPAADAGRAPTVIFFYGNGAFAAQMGLEFWNLRRLGVNVLIPEYPGYGMSGGKPSERGFYAAADAAYDYLQRRPGIGHGRIVAAGWSLGAAVAVDLAARRGVVALIAINAFTTLPAVAHALEPWMPVSLVIRSRFDNIQKIPAVTCPLLLIHGDRDELVPPTMTGELARAAPGRVTTFTVEGGGHNDVFAAGGDGLWKAVRIFLDAAK